jgi:hypothetical protein
VKRRKGIATPQARVASRSRRQITASRSALLLQCARPFDPKVDWLRDDTPSEGAQYGRAFHTAMAGAFAKVPTELREEVLSHAKTALRELYRWLRSNPFRNFMGDVHTVEGSYALNVAAPRMPSAVAFTARECRGPREEDHLYPDLAPQEIGGTYDRRAIGDRGLPLLILDHKTGDQERDVAFPDRKPQLLTLGLAGVIAEGSPGVVLAVLHAPRRGVPAVYAEHVPREDLFAHGRRMRRAQRRIGDGSMRPGPECKYCPARVGCPARDAALLEDATGLLLAGQQRSLQVVDGAGELSRAQKLGQLYDISRQSEALAARAQEEIKDAMLRDSDLHPETGRGVLTLEERSYESLGKSTVLRAYGKLEGERVLKKLRKDGAIEKHTGTKFRVR